MFVVWCRSEIAWHHGSCFLAFQTATIADEKLSVMTQTEITFTDEVNNVVFIYTFSHILLCSSFFDLSDVPCVFPEVIATS